MTNIKTKKYLSAALMLGALGTYGIAQAAPCTVERQQTNPDGSLTSATACNLGDGNTAAEAQTAINAANPGGLGLSWTFIDRDATAVAGEIDTAFSISGVTTGTWLINKGAIPSFDTFIVTLSGGPPLQNDFSWFLIDTSAGANSCSDEQLGAGWDLCGTWQMYGSGRGDDPSAVGSMDLFAATQVGDAATQAIPEPSTTLLAGIGLLGLALGSKRALKSKS